MTLLPGQTHLKRPSIEPRYVLLIASPHGVSSWNVSTLWDNESFRFNVLNVCINFTYVDFFDYDAVSSRVYAKFCRIVLCKPVFADMLLQRSVSCLFKIMKSTNDIGLIYLDSAKYFK